MLGLLIETPDAGEVYRKPAILECELEFVLELERTRICIVSSTQSSYEDATCVKHESLRRVELKFILRVYCSYFKYFPRCFEQITYFLLAKHSPDQVSSIAQTL